MSRLTHRFEDLRQQGRTALIPFITAGDPHPSFTVPALHALVKAGANIIEVGVPFSDPMADGPVIQRASERSLAHKMSLRKTLELVKQFRTEDNETPIVLMGYLNPITDEMAIDTAKKLRHKLEIDSLVITLGASGMVVANAQEAQSVPAIRVEVYDEAGAGDTVIATLALCATCGPIGVEALRLASHTAACVVRKVGVAVPSAEDLQQIAQVFR